MRNFDSVLASFLMFVGILFAGNVSAQEWKGTALSSVNPSVASPCYLYNVGKGAFLINGAQWGTAGSLNKDYGISITKITSNSRGYEIQTALSNTEAGTGKMLAYSYWNTTEADQGIYCDRTSGTAYANSYFTFTPVDGSTNNEYYISVSVNSNNVKVENRGTRYLVGVNEGEQIQTIGSVPTTDDGKWIIVTYATVQEKIQTVPADLDNPTNITFSIVDANFDRASSVQSSWNADYKKVSGAEGLRIGTQYRYSEAIGNSTGTYYSAPDYDSANEYTRANGKYWGVSVKGANGTMSQDVKVYYAGWYSVSCQGFYWNTASAPSKNETSAIFATIGDSSAKQYLALANTGDHVVPATWQAAEEYLFAKQYKNSIMIFVSPDDIGNPDPIIRTGADGEEYSVYYNPEGVDLTLGVEIAGVTNANEWTVFDDFQLEYMGWNNDLLLLEGDSEHNYITETKEEYKNTTLRLNRTFKTGAWNTLVLPVDLTLTQFETAFGSNARAAELQYVKDDVMRFNTIAKYEDDHMTKKPGKTLMLKAGTPYLVFVEYGASHNTEYIASLTKVGGDEIIKKVIGGVDEPYYVIPRVTLSDKSVLEHAKMGKITNPVMFEDGESSITFNGTYEKTYKTVDGENTLLPGYTDMRGKIVLKDGKLWWLTAPYGMKSFRGWFEPKGYQSDAQARVSFEIDGIEDDATYIYGIEADDETATAEKFANGIYTINGMNMSATSVDSLPKGIYIVNGKKFIVK